MAVIDENLLDQEIGTDGGFVTGTKFLVDLQGKRVVSISRNALDEMVGGTLVAGSMGDGR